MKFTPEVGDEEIFKKLFLGQHSPYLSLDKAEEKKLPNRLRLLRREIRNFLGPRLDGSGLLKKLDATTPRKDPDVVSYRYPFLHEGDYIAPCDYEEWESYQGNREGIQSAVQRLLKAVDDAFKLYKRDPAA